MKIKNKYSSEVDEWEILKEEQNKVIGKRLTKFNCTKCKLPLSESDLYDIRLAHAPCQHYNCCFPKKVK